MRKTLFAIAISCPIVAADQSPFPPRTQSGFLLAPKVRLWARTCHGKTPFRGLGGSKPVRSGRESQAWNHVIHAGRLLFFIRLPHESAMPKASKLIAGALSEATPPVTINGFVPTDCQRQSRLFRRKSADYSILPRWTAKEVARVAPFPPHARVSAAG